MGTCSRFQDIEFAADIVIFAITEQNIQREINELSEHTVYEYIT